MDAANFEGSYDALREKRGLPKGDPDPQITIDDVIDGEEDGVENDMEAPVIESEEPEDE